MLTLLIAGCNDVAPDPPQRAAAGATLEQAAIAAGLVADPSKLDPVGAYASATDRVCIIDQGDNYRIGASIDYGEQQGCVARGTATGRETLQLDLGEECRFDARFDGTRIVFPATVPSACNLRCSGRATLAALTAAKHSAATTEARVMRTIDGHLLCS